MSITDKIRKFTNRIKNTDGDYDLVSYDTDASTVYTDYKNKKTLDNKIIEMDEATNSKISYNDVDNTLFIELEKVHTGWTGSEQSQGMAYDPNRKLFYMACINPTIVDRSKRYITIKVIDENTFEQTQDFMFSIAGHYNNLNYIKRGNEELLISSCGNNTTNEDDYRQMGIVKLENHPIQEGKVTFTPSSAKLPDASWCVLPFIAQNDTQGNPYNISYISFPAIDSGSKGSPHATILSCVEGNTSLYYTIGRINLPSATGISQGGEIRGNRVYKLYAYDPRQSGTKKYSRNNIQIFGINGSYYNTIYLKYDTLFEAEDICINNDGILYVVDARGNIYRGKTPITYFINDDYAYGCNTSVTALSDIVLYDYCMTDDQKDGWKNGTEEWISGTVNEKKNWLLKSFSISPFTYPRHLKSIVGNMCINGEYAPVVFYRIPKITTDSSGNSKTTYSYYISGRISSYTHTGKVITCNLTYKCISDEASGYMESYRFILDEDNTWIGYTRQKLEDGKLVPDYETRYGIDIVNHTNFNGSWFAGTLIGKHICDTSSVPIKF